MNKTSAEIQYNIRVFLLTHESCFSFLVEYFETIVIEIMLNLPTFQNLHFEIV